MLALINAPSVLGLRPTGVELLPEALQRAGLSKKLAFYTTQTVTPPAYNTKRDPVSHLLNPKGLATYAVQLADAIQETLQNNQFPVVLGGDCSNLLGIMLALKRMGRYGLFDLDGHADFYLPEQSPTGQAADSALALLSGRGSDVMTNLEGLGPLAQEKDIVLFGQRDQPETVKQHSLQIADTNIHVFDLATIQRAGVQESAQLALAALMGRPIEGFWIHLDVDVIDDAQMPAVDYRLPGGLTFDELETVLTLLLHEPKAIGLDIAIYNPKLDPHQTGAKKLTKLLASVLANR